MHLNITREKNLWRWSLGSIFLSISLCSSFFLFVYSLVSVIIRFDSSTVTVKPCLSSTLPRYDNEELEKNIYELFEEKKIYFQYLLYDSSLTIKKKVSELEQLFDIYIYHSSFVNNIAGCFIDFHYIILIKQISYSYIRSID